MTMLLRDKMLERFDVLEVVSLLSIFAVAPKFRKQQDDKSRRECKHIDEELLTKGDARSDDPQVTHFREQVNALCIEVFGYARLVSDAYVAGGLATMTSDKDRDYVNNWRGGFLTFEQFQRVLTDGKAMVLATRAWLMGRSFAEALSIAGVDAGTFSKAIRKTGKVLREMMTAARKLGRDAFHDSLYRERSCLTRGLPYLPSLLLKGLDVSQHQPESWFLLRRFNLSTPA